MLAFFEVHAVSSICTPLLQSLTGIFRLDFPKRLITIFTIQPLILVTLKSTPFGNSQKFRELHEILKNKLRKITQIENRCINHI